jgi:hypothetical protein
MKSIFILLTVLSSFFVKAAENPTGSETAQECFKTTFATASDVTWSYSNNLYKASFILNGQYATAFYNAEGGFLGITRHISSAQLPLTLQTALKTEHKDKWVTELFEFSTEDGVQYYITLENADQKLVLKASNGSLWSQFQKLRKS